MDYVGYLSISLALSLSQTLSLFPNHVHELLQKCWGGGSNSYMKEHFSVLKRRDYA